MANSKITSLLAIIALSNLVAGARAASPKVIKLPFSVSQQVHDTNDSITRRGAARVSLKNDAIRYLIDVEVGTPGQKMQMQLDTGSSDTWMFGPGSCNGTTDDCAGEDFNMTKSSSTKLLARDWLHIEYLQAGSKVKGDYVTDVLRMGNITINNMTMGVASSAKGLKYGVVGLGPAASQSATGGNWGDYPTILDHLVDKGQIKARAFSIWLDSADAKTGNILFGGYDEAMFQDNLTVLPMVERMDGQVHELSVALVSFSVTSSDGEEREGFRSKSKSKSKPRPALIDTGSTRMFLPRSLAKMAADSAGGKWMDDVKQYVVDCNKLRANNGTVNFGFTSTNKDSDLVMMLALLNLAEDAIGTDGHRFRFPDGRPLCFFGISTLGDNSPIILGDTFMQSVYVVCDLDKKQISMAAGIYGSRGGSVREIVSEDAGKDRGNKTGDKPGDKPGDLGGNEHEEDESGVAAERSPDIVTVLVVAGLIYLGLFDDVPFI